MVAAANGDKQAAERLLPLVYEQLRKAAQISMQSERTGHTLTATALVHEAYLKLAGPREVPWAGRGHFYAAAGLSQREPEEIVRFDELVDRLEAESPDGAAVVRLRFFAGLSVEQTASALGLSTSTVDRRWAFARAWLFQRLHEQT
jgi:hypothetical protein